MQGFVVYAPTLSVAGEKNRVPVYELANMLTGAVPKAESQLVIDRCGLLTTYNSQLTTHNSER